MFTPGYLKFCCKIFVCHRNWKSFCLTINNSTISLLVNGRPAKFTGNPKLPQKIRTTFQPNFSVGYFVGQLTDFNVWNVTLSPDQLKSIALNCSGEITSTLPPKSINWSKFMAGQSYNSSLKVSVTKKDACFVSTGWLTIFSILNH